MIRVIIIYFLACGSLIATPKKDDFIGFWKSEEGSSLVELALFEDGKFAFSNERILVDGKPIRQQGKYSILSAKLSLRSSNNKKYYYKYELEKDILRLIPAGKDQGIIILKKQKTPKEIPLIPKNAKTIYDLDFAAFAYLDATHKCCHSGNCCGMKNCCNKTICANLSCKRFSK